MQLTKNWKKNLLTIAQNFTESRQDEVNQMTLQMQSVNQTLYIFEFVWKNIGRKNVWIEKREKKKRKQDLSTGSVQKKLLV